MEQLAAAHPELFIEFIAVPHLSPAHIARLARCSATLRLHEVAQARTKQVGGFVAEVLAERITV